MGSREDRQLQAFLDGRLDAEQTRRFLARVKDREEFREHLLFQAASAPTVSHTDGGERRYHSYTPDEVRAAKAARPRRRLRWTAFSVFMVVLLTMSGLVTKAELEHHGPTVDELCRATLAKGLPYPVHPEGLRTSLPRMLQLYLPAGAQTVTVRIRESGQALFERTYAVGEPGVSFSEAEGRVGEEAYTLTDAWLPFPGPPELSLKPGSSYDFVASLDGRTWSTPLGFSLEP